MMIDLWLLFKWIFLVTMIIFLIFFVFVMIILRIIRRYHKFPIPAFATRLIDNPWRRFIQKPKVIAERMHLEAGMIVVEIGPGKGSYTKAVAKKVIPNGKVYALDIQESVIESLKKRIEKEEISNIIPIVGDAYNFPFEDKSIDRVFANTCLPEIPDPIRVLRDCNRILKPDGLVSLCEILPDPDYPRRKTEIRWAEESGFEIKEKFGNFFSYQLNFTKKSNNK